MTFYEAALRVLESAASPLHVQEITRQSLEKGLLSHVGKTPEMTMLARLAAMAKRPRDRKLMVTAKDTFALTDWMLPEDAEALQVTGVPLPNPEQDLPPLRPLERHPEPKSDFQRASGRQEGRRRRDDERRRRFPPIHEVAFEMLTEAQAFLVPNELLTRMRAKELASDELSVSMLLEALAEDNQRRIDDGRRPQFSAQKPEGGELALGVEAAGDGAVVAELQAAFCRAVGLPFENGRLVSQRLKQPPAAVAVLPVGDDQALVQAAKHAAREARKSTARLFRKRLGELDGGTLERACVKLLHAHHFRELKVAKRSKEGPIFTARRREGSLELRFAIRILKGAAPVERRHVHDVRRDLQHHASHIGLILSAGEARGDARGDALGGGGMVMLWCGDHLAEKFFEGEVGVAVTRVELYDLDEAFFSQAQVDAAEAARRREERHREKDGDAPGEQAQGSQSQPTPPPADATGEAAAAAPAALSAEGAPGADDAGGDDGDEDDEGPEAPGGEAAGGAPGADGVGGEGRRRRRRRRRRRGQGPRVEGQPGVEGAAPNPGAVSPADPGAVAAPAAPVAPSEAPPPPPAPVPPAAPEGAGQG